MRKKICSARRALLTPASRVLTITGCLVAGFSVDAATIDVIDGHQNDYVSFNQSLGNTGSFRDATPNGAYYRYPDMNGVAAGEPVFDLSGGVDAAGAAPTVYGGFAWRDNQRSDDTSDSWATVVSWRNNGAGTGVDTLRAYSATDLSGITPDEGFGVMLFDVAVGGSQEVASLTLEGRLGRSEGANFSADFRWAVVSNGQLFVSQSTFSLTNSLGNATLSDAQATNWAAYTPTDVSELKFDASGTSFSAVVLDGVSHVGVVYAMSDSDSQNSSWWELSQLSVTTDAAPQYDWLPVEIKSAAEAQDPLGGGEGEQHPRAFARSESDPSYVYAGIDTGGTWRSTHHGVTWVKCLDNGLYGKGIQSIVVDPNHPETIYAYSEISTSNGGEMQQLLEPYEGIYRSDDAGDNWELVVSIPNPVTPAYGNYRIWRTLMTPVVDGSTTTWYAVFDGSGFWEIVDPNDGSLPVATQLVSDPMDLYYCITSYELFGSHYLLYGNKDGLYKRKIGAYGLGAEIDMQVPTGNTPNNVNNVGGVTGVYVNPTDPQEVWALRRWDRPYRSLNAHWATPTWTEIEVWKEGRTAYDPAFNWDVLYGGMEGAVMGITPFATSGHTITVNDGGTNRTVPARGFLAIKTHIFHLIWDGATPVFQRYYSANSYDYDFEKRPSLADHRKAPFGAHAGFAFNANDADDVAAYGTSTFWRTTSGGFTINDVPAWKQTGYGHTGFAVQLGINGIYIDDNNPSIKWFPWNDVGVAKTTNDMQSFSAIGEMPTERINPDPDEFYWKSAANVVVNPLDSDIAVAQVGIYGGVKFKIGRTTDGGATWEVASTDPNHRFSERNLAGGVYITLNDGQGQTIPRAFLGAFRDASSNGSNWTDLAAHNDAALPATEYEAPRSDKVYSVVGASDGSGESNPHNPTLYAFRTDGWQEIIRGEPDPSKSSGFRWWRVWAGESFKHPAGSCLAVVSPANPNIVFGASKAGASDPQLGTPFGQMLTRIDFTGQKDSSNPSYVTKAFLPAQPDLPGSADQPYNVVNALAADPYDDRVVYCVSAGMGLPFVFKGTFNADGSVDIEDLSGDLPRIGATSITYDPAGGGRLLISGFAGTWVREL